jgi:hypothetical protein
MPKGPTMLQMIGAYHARTPDQKKQALEAIKAWCLTQEIQCLAGVYSSNRVIMPFRCIRCSHEWSTTWYSICSGTGCPECAKSKIGDSRRESIETVRAECVRRGWTLLSTEYKDSKSPLKIERPGVGVSYTTWGSLRLGVTRQNFGKVWKHSIESIHLKCELRGWKLISTEYKNSREKLEFVCDKGHKIIATWASAANHGCRECAIVRRSDLRRLDVSIVRAECEKRGWKLLSEEYRNSTSKLEFQCGHCHTFRANWNAISSGQGCPKCSQLIRESFGERVCRTAFEQLFEQAFPCTRDLPWLQSEKGFPLELDGYNADLRLAFEHQGQQHYQDRGGHMSVATADLMQRDARKRELCKAHGVVLIEVPEIGTLLPFEGVLPYIIQSLQAAGIRPRSNWASLELDKRIIFTPRLEDKLHMLAKLVAEEHGGQLLSETWRGIEARYLFKCCNPSHPSFHTKASHIIHSKSWCRRCYSETVGDRCRKPFAIFQQISQTFKARLLSGPDEYRNRDSVLSFECGVCGMVFQRKASRTLDAGALCPSTSCRRLRKINRKPGTGETA